MLSLLLVLAALAGPFRAPRVDYAPAPATLPLVTVPADRTRLYVVTRDATLGERLFFLDTGYSLTTCDDDFVASLGLRSRPALAWSKGELGSVRLRKATLPDFDLGGHTIHSLPCAVRDLSSTSSIPSTADAPVAGVLGSNLLGRFRVEIDPGEGRLTLWDPRSPPPPPGAGSTPMRRERRVGYRRVVELELDGKVARVVVDTGATSTWVDARRLDLRKVDSRTTVVRGSGRQSRQVRQQETYAVTRASLAGQDLGALQVLQRSRPPWRPGLLGMTVLRRFSVTLDPASRTLSVRPVDRWGVPGWVEWRRKDLEAALAAGQEAVRPQLVDLEASQGHIARALELAVPEQGAPLEVALARARTLLAAQRDREAVALLRDTVGRFPESAAARRALGLRLLRASPQEAVPLLEPPERDLARLLSGQVQDPPRVGDPILRALWQLALGQPADWAAVAAMGPREALLALDAGARPEVETGNPAVDALLQEARGMVGVSVAPCLRAPLTDSTDALVAARCGRTQEAMRTLDRRRPALTDGPAMGLWYDAMAQVARATENPRDESVYRNLALDADPASPYLWARGQVPPP